MNKLKKFLIPVVVLWIVFLYFSCKPSINIHSIGFWFFLLFSLAPIALISLDYSINPKTFFTNKKNLGLISLVALVGLVIVLAGFIGTPLLGGLNAYRNRITIPESSDFAEIEEFDQRQVQIIDKNIAMSLADRVFGEMGAEIVSQHQISNNYASVVVNNTMYRITPVEYSGFIKWLSTKNKGTPGFISVNVTTGDTEFHELEEGLKYTQNACFLSNLNLHLRLKYPTFIFGTTKFEVDDNWHPYWVSEVMSYRFIGRAEDVKGVVITDPVTGECEYYDVKDVPSWVDNVYSATLISEQYNSYGELVNGLFNFSQKGITAVTDDYAYLQKDGHLWMYTGVTSVGNDESNVGFIYVDLQDKDVIYIVSAGAEEYSARASAEGAVQEKGYEAVFPTMVNINGEPVYFMGLKDYAGLIKSYAFVSYKNYQKVGIGTTVNEALKNYTGKNVIDNDSTSEKQIVIAQIESAVIDGNTTYFIKTKDNEYYRCSIEISDQLPFIKVGDKLDVLVSENIIAEIK